MIRRLFGLLVPFLGSAGAVYLSTLLFDQDRFDHVVSMQVAQGDVRGTAQTIAIVTVIFGLVNLLVKPVVRLLTFPIRILSFGLFSLVINGGMLLLTGYAAERINAPFHVKLSAWVIAAAAVIGIAAGIFNWLGDKITTARRTKVVERVVERPPAPAQQYRPAPEVRRSTGYTPAPPPPPPPPASPYTQPPYGRPHEAPPSQPGHGYGSGQGGSGQGGYGSGQGGYGSGQGGYGQGSSYGQGDDDEPYGQRGQ